METKEGTNVIGGVSLDTTVRTVDVTPEKQGGRPQSQGLYNGSSYGGMNCDAKDCSSNKKIFVGGLPPTLTVEELKAYFEKFGTVEDVVVMSDRETNRPRGFGFVTFDSVEAAMNALQNRYHELNSKRVEVKKSVSKEGMSRKKFCNRYDTYNAGLDFCTESTSFGGSSTYGDFCWHYYRPNPYGFGAYNDVGYQEVSYAYYPYQSLDYYSIIYSYHGSNFYGSIYPYQSSHYHGNTYPSQTPNFYLNAPTSVKPSHKNGWDHLCGSRIPVVKTSLNVKDSGDFVSNVATTNQSLPQKFDALNLEGNAEGNEKRDLNCNQSVASDSIDEESLLKRVCDSDMKANSDGRDLSLRCVGDDDDDGSIEVTQALNLHIDKQIGVEQSSSSTTNSS